MPTRAFICVELEAGLRKNVVELQRNLKATDLVKWVEEENLHLTLKFLGDLSDEQVLSVSRLLKQAVKSIERFEVKLQGTGTFPGGRNPRVVWVGLDDPAARLVELSKRIDEALEPIGIKKEERPFVPHLTIGRVRGYRGAGDLADKVQVEKSFQGGAQSIDRITFMRSVLTPKGPTYTPLERVFLG